MLRCPDCGAAHRGALPEGDEGRPVTCLLSADLATWLVASGYRKVKRRVFGQENHGSENHDGARRT